MRDVWRIIDTGSCDAAFNMALDEAIAIAVRQDLSPPTLRIYAWNLASVSIGYFQKSEDVATEFCRDHNIPVVRRPTGGRAVLHDNEITYSFSVKTKTGLFSKGLLDSYKTISSAFQLALSKVGLPSESLKSKPASQFKIQNAKPHNPLCFQSISYGEISINNIKVIGSAQKRWADGLLQQGAIPLTVDEELVLNLFGRDVVYKGSKSLLGLKQILPGLSPDKLKRAICIAFEETFRIKLVDSGPSEQEILLAEELEAEKYLNDAWTFRR